MLRLVVCVLVVGVGWGSVATPAEARKSPGASKGALRERARGLFSQAQIQFRLGRFARARKLYTRAYEVLPLAGFLFNIAQCHRMEKRYERALFFYRSYLSAKPGARNRDIVLLLMRRSREGLGQQREAAARRRAEAVRHRARRPVLVVTPRPYLPPSAPPTTPVTRKWWFWTSVGAGVAALVVAGVMAGLFARAPGFEATDLGTLDRRSR